MKTKTFKRIVAATAALMMMSAVPMMSVPGVWAAEPTYSITIDNTGGVAGRTYEAYQIFSGELSGTGATNDKYVLSNIKWATGVNGDDIISALQANSTVFGTDFSNMTTAAQVAEKLASYGDDDARLIEFAKIADKNKGSSKKYEQSNGKITTSSPGYYLVIDNTSSSSLSENARSRFIMEVVGNKTIKPKVGYPTLTKQIMTGDAVTDRADANTASTGENVYYELKSAVPDMKGYNQYYFMITDVLSEGLKLNDDFSVIIDGYNNNQPITQTTDPKAGQGNYYIEKTTNGQGFKLVINDFIKYAGLKGNDIIITYSAELGGNNTAESDKIGYGLAPDSANTNKTNLVYSNNPNVDYKGSTSSGDTPSDNTEPDKPYEPPMHDHTDSNNDNTPDDPTDDTPKDDNVSKTQDDKVVTYTASLKLTKIDGSDITKKLSGAVFAVYSDEQCSNDKIVKAEVTSGDDGIIEFKGLGAGTYWIKETKAPNGYNLLASPLKLEIDTETLSDSAVKWKVGDNSDADTFTISADSSVYESTVKNNAGTTLPSTGGIGTTIFYVSGGTLILGAVVVMITKKRMSLKEDK